MKYVSMCLFVLLLVSCAEPVASPEREEVTGDGFLSSEPVVDREEQLVDRVGDAQENLDGTPDLGDGKGTDGSGEALVEPNDAPEAEDVWEQTDDGGDGESASPLCTKPLGSWLGEAGQWAWPGGMADAELTDGEACHGTFTLSTTAKRLDGVPGNPRTVMELEGFPTLRTGNVLFDGLHALALEEMRENSVETIQDGAFNNGEPLSCGTGGCFETGKKWNYVWTRDTAYSVDLALGALDPIRSRNSLLFKLSPFRGKTDEEIVQDTGTGGSWPVSTDRVSWALGAWSLLPHLTEDSDATEFKVRALAALSNTLERDRLVVFDPADGLYRGEQSFLDWREQSYPIWTKDTVVDIAMSKALSTNILHLRALQIASSLAGWLDEGELEERYEAWGSALLQALRDAFWLEEEGMFSSFIATTLDPTPVRRFDLLGSSLAIVHGVATPEQASSILENYPHYGPGAPVIWPQQQDVPIYHNRGEWPFVTAYWLRAAAHVRHGAVAHKMMNALVRGAALNLSNMENFEAGSGNSFLEDGPASGPVVNSQRQLWSVAGYLSMVHHTLFGIRTRPGPQGATLRLEPFVTESMRTEWFPGMKSLVLQGIPLGNKILAIELQFPEEMEGSGGYVTGAITLNGSPVEGQEWDLDELPPEAHFRIQLESPIQAEPMAMTEVDDTNYQEVFGPRSPEFDAIEGVDGKVQLQFGLDNENPEEVSIHIYREGKLVADLPGTATTWDDPTAPILTEEGICYALEVSYLVSGNRSQHSPPRCWWRADYSIIDTVVATQFEATGGELVNNHGRWHYQNWGGESDTLTVSNMNPLRTGHHLLQVEYGNGAGPVNSGVTCGLKSLVVEDEESGEVVAEGPLIMPHLGEWDRWSTSNFIPALLDANRSYRVRVVHSAAMSNMSALAHFEQYTGGAGGGSGAYHSVNISEVKLMSR